VIIPLGCQQQNTRLTVYGIAIGTLAIVVSLKEKKNED
jgi:hypothetical protein